MVTKVALQLRAAGFHTLDVPGGSFFTVMLRHLREDPVASFVHIRRLLRGQTLRCGTRPSSTGRYGIASYASMDFYTRFMVQRLGIDAFWIYDCLYDMPEMERRARSVHEAGGEVVPAVMYGISPVHTDAWYAERVREMVGSGDHVVHLRGGRARHPHPGALPERSSPRLSRPPATFRSSCTATTRPAWPR